MVKMRGKRRLRGAEVTLALAVAVAVLGCSSGSQRPSSGPTPEPAATETTAVAAAGRAAHTATTLTPEASLVAGGCTVDGCSEASSEAFILTASDVRATGQMHEARDAHTATTLADGRVLVTGGFTGEGRPPLASAELYDADRGTWTTTGSLALGRGGHAAALLGGSRVLVAGGWVGPSQYTDSTEVFDPATGTFLAGPSLRDPVDGPAATTLAEGSVLVTGGQSSPGAASDQAVLISPDGVAAEVGPLRQARFKHASVGLPDGRVLVLGGTPDDERLLRSTELYDPATQRFTPGPRLVNGRYKLAGGVAVTPDGTVIVAGGGNGAELLDPATGTWRSLRVVPAERLSFSTVSVVDDTVRILGGYDEGIQLTHTDITMAVP